jgi:chromosome segregation ATPase
MKFLLESRVMLYFDKDTKEILVTPISQSMDSLASMVKVESTNSEELHCKIEVLKRANENYTCQICNLVKQRDEVKDEVDSLRSKTKEDEARLHYSEDHKENLVCKVDQYKQTIDDFERRFDNLQKKMECRERQWYASCEQRISDLQTQHREEFATETSHRQQELANVADRYESTGKALTEEVERLQIKLVNRDEMINDLVSCKELITKRVSSLGDGRVPSPGNRIGSRDEGSFTRRF